MSAPGLAEVIDYCRTRDTICANPRQWQVLHHIVDCRTAGMGGALYRCAACQSQWVWYHSCRDRHCPQCQRNASALWCDKQRQQLLPVPYFHLVFTLPHDLNAWVPRYGDLLYRLLFQCCWQTLSVMSQRKLKGQLGMTAVLHTWGQRLTRHIHLHCLIPAGVLGGNRRWRQRGKGYLLPVKALSTRFRGLMVSSLRTAYREGKLAALTRRDVDQTLDQLMAKPWVVYSKSALRYRDTLVQYLARYSHRIGLSNHRLLRWQGDTITLAYYDYRKSVAATLELRPEELLRRFLLHVLPKGFMRIRHYGFLANAIKSRCLPLIRRQVERGAHRPAEEVPPEKAGSSLQACCPRCGSHPISRLCELQRGAVTIESTAPG